MLRGALIGDSQLKFLNRTRLRLHSDVHVCTFSFGGATAVRLADKCRQLGLAALDFVVLYVGGNDLSNGRSPLDVSKDIMVSGIRFISLFDAMDLHDVAPGLVPG